MIIVINPDKVTGQAFFTDLVNYLYAHEDVTLRQIKKAFPDVKSIDRAIETYVQAGYITRANKRYALAFSPLETGKLPQLDEMVFVETTSEIASDLQERAYTTKLSNQTNGLVLLERTDFYRDSLTLSNFFYKLAHGYALSKQQEELYALLGDVNPEYALKYMTTFLLKFTRKELVKQKRPDIFVQALVLLGYIKQVDEVTYQSCVAIDKDSLEVLTYG
ncbi:DUF1803 domain-containing protein [Streptococcus hyointestinalis]|uniref:DUF1803 domain-containing protein n=1 Tax=Streptococcus hyointestinalis TaxID=1337 RepID=UPI00351362D3